MRIRVRCVLPGMCLCGNLPFRLLTLTAYAAAALNAMRGKTETGETSPVAVEDVARVVAALLANPQPHIGKVSYAV